MMIVTPLHALFTLRPPNNHAFHDGKRFVSWHEFSTLVATYVSYYNKRSEKRWLLTSPSPQEFIVHFFALLHADKQVVIPPNMQSGTLAQLAEAYDAIADIELAPDETATVDWLNLDPQTTIISLYTSGSTGIPKRVQKNLAQFEAEIVVLESIWGSTLEKNVMMATVPHHHIYGLLFRLLWPLSAGRCFDATTCTHPDLVCERLMLFKHASLISSPAQLARWPDLMELSSLSPTLNVIFSSGGALPNESANKYIEQLGYAPIEVFGSSETGGVAWRQQRNGSTPWETLPSVSVACGEDGALLLSSPFLASDSPWRMDDAIELLPDGRFYLLGRLDRIVKVEEKRLSLPEMEAKLTAHTWINAAITLPLSGRRQYIGAVVTLSSDGEQQLKQHGKRHVTHHLRTSLAAHYEAVLLPRRWRFVPSLPTNAQGKHTYATLSALFIDDENHLTTT